MNPVHQTNGSQAPCRRQMLSMLMDGQVQDVELAKVLDGWRDDGDLRADWHAWHMAGDVMRSTDPWPARADGGDAAFLASLRQRLAQEPVPLAPAALVAASVPRPRGVRRLMAPVAVAAGFVAVAGVLVVLQSGAPQGAGGVLASGESAGTLRAGSAPVPGAVITVASPSAGGVRATTAAEIHTGLQPDGSGQVVRDARLDDYFKLHRPVVNTLGGVETAGGRQPTVLGH